MKFMLWWIGLVLWLMYLSMISGRGGWSMGVFIFGIFFWIVAGFVMFVRAVWNVITRANRAKKLNDELEAIRGAEKNEQ